MKLDTTKVYYLGDLSDEQKEELLIELRCIDNPLSWRFFFKNSIYLMFNDEWYEGHDLDDMRNDLDNNYPLVNALTLFDKTDYRDIILDEETYYNLDGISKDQYNELQNEYNGNRRFCIVDLKHKENEKLDDNLCLGKFGKDWMVFYTTKENKKEFKNVIDLFNNRCIISIQVRIQELNNELIELDEEMRKLTYEN